eukprot:TRINITY_DN22039_c0_g1_i1.p1 TRINITY_DN22039_c0_g1~~TRINITY_DN22039_c0_g1_i1.p1  ORF type:complete len:737 (+),score=176.02 TRINITY_DN22039_c0_g1_i1:83-2212(+)
MLLPALSGLAAFAALRRRHFDSTFNKACYPEGGGGPNPQTACFSNLSAGFAQRYASFYVDTLKVDSMLIEAVPDGGWANYHSDVIPTWPALSSSGVDWMGEIMAEFARRGIETYSYINVQQSARVIQGGGGPQGEEPHLNWTYTRENATGTPPVLPLNCSDTRFGWCSALCINAPGRVQTLADLTREVVRRYKPRAIRYDGLYGTITDCRTEGDRALWLEMFGEPMPEVLPASDWRRIVLFWRETVTRLVRALHEAALSEDPTIRIWFNGFHQKQIRSLESWNDIDSAFRYSNVGFIEFGGVFEWAFVEGAVAPSHGVINGCLLSPLTPATWEAVAYGAIMYQYFSADAATGLPDTKGKDGQRIPFNATLVAAFMNVMEDISPYLDGAEPVRLPVCVVFSEATRFRYVWYDRTTYVVHLRDLFTYFQEQYGLALRFVTAINLWEGTLRGCSVVAVPESSGLNATAVAEIRRYAAGGGKVLWSGDAPLYDADGSRAAAPLDGLGLCSAATDCSAADGDWALRPLTALGRQVLTMLGNSSIRSGPSCINKVAVCGGAEAAVVAEATPAGSSTPLLTELAVGNGTVVYLAPKHDNAVGGATGAVLPLLVATVRALLGGDGELPYWLSPQAPLNRTEVVVSVQRDGRPRPRYMVYFVYNDSHSVTFNRKVLPATHLVGQYPTTGWAPVARNVSEGLRIDPGAPGVDHRVAILE